VSIDATVSGLRRRHAPYQHPSDCSGRAVRDLCALRIGANLSRKTRAHRRSQQVIVDDRAGAGGNIGAEVASHAPADGYTVFLAHTNHGVNTALYRKLSYDLLKDFSPVTMLANSAFVASVHPALPVRSVPDLIKMAKSRPSDLTYASAGTGSGTFFAAEYFKRLAKIDILHVPYKGGGPALSAVLAGETMMYFRRSPHSYRQAAAARGHCRATAARSAGRSCDREVSAGLRADGVGRFHGAVESAPGDRRGTAQGVPRRIGAAGCQQAPG
jgi:tripartite-type tricarboxylate transporter receptor subunit TctC